MTMSPQSPPPPPGTTEGRAQIVVTARFMWLAWLVYYATPRYRETVVGQVGTQRRHPAPVVEIDGDQIGAGWGRNLYPVRPGEHRVNAHVRYFLPARIGPTSVTVSVADGETRELEYRAPVWLYAAGSLGPPPQQYHGFLPVLLAYRLYEVSGGQHAV